jgi:hypothetical protein
MPIENAAVMWPEEISPYRPIARITVKPQVAWSEARSAAVDDGMSFSPWHGLAAHRPLGGIMRVRKAVYEMAKKFRAEKNRRVRKNGGVWEVRAQLCLRQVVTTVAEGTVNLSGGYSPSCILAS